MADIEFGEAVGGGDPGYAIDVKTIINGFGALVSLALIAGLGWWGYQLMVRDVTGVPVVRALQGPMRVAPEDPGGSSAQYQGLAVNNIPAVGEAEAPADRLVLAPKPTSLTPEDQPAEVLGAIAAAAEAEKQPGKQPGAGAGAAPGTVARQPGGAGAGADAAAENGNSAAAADAGAGADADADAPPADRASLIEATLKSLTAPEAPTGGGAAARPAPIPADVPGVSRSLLPLPRPAALRGAAVAVPAPATATAAAATPPAARPQARAAAGAASGAGGDGVPGIDPADIPPGTRLVQLGAYESPEAARADWRRIAARFDALMADKARVIEKAQAGGRVFYRLRVHGFRDMSDARRFCSALILKDADCIPVVSR